MSRRIILPVVALSLLVTLLPAQAQHAGKVHRIGVLGTVPSALWDAFGQGMADLGYVEGQNITIEWRFSEGKHDRLPTLATELVQLKVDVIVTAATPPTVAAKQATSTIPIVTAAVGDPVGSGLVASLARPGGNLTGLAAFTPELSTKQLELLKEVDPGLSRVAVLWMPDNRMFGAAFWEHLEAAGRAAGMTVNRVAVQSADEFDGAFATLTREGAGGLLVLPESRFWAHRTRLGELALTHKLAAIQMFKGFAHAGFLMSYGVRLPTLYRRAALFVDRIIKGANPAEIPVEGPTEFSLAVNLKTAKALGLSIPESVLMRADTIIE